MNWTNMNNIIICVYEYISFCIVFEHLHQCHGQLVLLVLFSCFSLSFGWWVYIAAAMQNSNVVYTV